MELDAFFATILGSNPFSSTRVNSPDDPVVTVSEIHSKEFETLCQCCQLARRESRALGISLQGNAGVGKSHLLSRLGAWCQRENQAIYVYLHNVMASPEEMPRHFLRSVVSRMASAQESFKNSALYGLMKSMMKSLRKSGELAGDRVYVSQARNAFLARAATLGLRDDRINAAVFEVLFRFFADVNLHPHIDGPVAARIASIVDWLSGDAIADEAADAIGIPADRRQRDPDGLVRLEDDHHVEQVVLILAALAQASNQCLVVCFDQFDNLSPEQVRSFSRFAHALLDHARSLVLIVAGVSESLLRFRETGVISEAQWDRMAEREIELHLIRRQQAEELLHRRLEPIQDQGQSCSALAKLLETQSTFPIRAGEFERRFGEALELRPRAVVKWADEVWRGQQERLLEVGGATWLAGWSATPPENRRPKKSLSEAIDAEVARALHEIIADRRNHPGTLPLDADNLATVIERLLVHCRACDEKLLIDVTRVKKDRPSQLVIRRRLAGVGAEHKTAATVITSVDGRSARHPLERLAESSEVHRRVLITDEERRMPKTSTIQEAFERLKSDSEIPFRHIETNYQQRVELEALRQVIDDALNITIEFPPGSDRSLTSTEVAQSLYRQGLLLSHAVLAELFSHQSRQVESGEVRAVTMIDTEAVAPPSTPPTVGHFSDKIETVIHGNLGWRISITSNDVVREVLEMLAAPRQSFEDLHIEVVKVARVGEQRGDLIVKEHANGLLLMKP